MAGRLVGKVVLIFGGASGIGAAHARVFAREGAKVTVGDIQEEQGKTVVREVKMQGSIGRREWRLKRWNIGTGW